MRNLVILILVLFLPASLAAQRQTVTAGSSPFLYRIRLEKLDQKSKELVVRLSIVNKTDKDIVIDKYAVRYKVGFSRQGRSTGNGGVGPGLARVITSDPSRPYEGDFILLRPGEAYRSTETLDIDGDFFEDDSRFTVWFTYGFFQDSEFAGLRVWKGTSSSNKIVFRTEK